MRESVVHLKTKLPSFYIEELLISSTIVFPIMVYNFVQVENWTRRPHKRNHSSPEANTTKQ